MRVPDKIELINQDDMKSCSLACVAMLTGKSLLEVRVVAKDIGIEAPCSLLEVARILALFNLYALPKISIGSGVITWGSVFLVSAFSQNLEDDLQGCHHVIADLRGEEEVVYDPQKGREGLKYYEFEDLKLLDAMEIINVG